MSFNFHLVALSQKNKRFRNCALNSPYHSRQKSSNQNISRFFFHLDLLHHGIFEIIHYFQCLDVASLFLEVFSCNFSFLSTIFCRSKVKQPFPNWFHFSSELLNEEKSTHIVQENRPQFFEQFCSENLQGST